jgi:hypothetical protein
MFSADAFIDTVQTGKKTFVTTFVTNDKVKEALVDFIDAQADYTKKAAKVGTDTFSRVATESVKQAQELAKYDYNKFLDAFKVAKK